MAKMIKIKLKRPLEMGFSTTKQTLKPGMHTVEESWLDAWYIPGLIAAGDLVIEDEIPAGPAFPLLDVYIDGEGLSTDDEVDGEGADLTGDNPETDLGPEEPAKPHISGPEASGTSNLPPSKANQKPEPPRVSRFGKGKK